MRTSSLFSLPSLIALVLACITWDATPARATEAMPNVVGQSRRAAVRALEAKGYVVEVVTIAGHPPGIVASQDPAAGQPIEPGEEVELHVGVRARIETVAPSAIGMTEEQVFETLDDTYFVEVEYGPGPRRLEGRVVSQTPNAGAQLLYRGRLLVRIVRNAVDVPALVGRPREEALRLLEEAGLVASISFGRSRGATRGLVLSQVPRSGAEILPGGTVELQIAGERPDGERRRRRVRVPDLTGLNMRDAEELVFAIGLTPHQHLVNVRGSASWTVLSQEAEPGTALREGQSLGYEVARPGASPDRVSIPTLYGLSQRDARDLLGHLGFRARIAKVASGLPVDTVFEQSPAPGPLADAGTEVVITVAAKPGPLQRLRQRRVPDVSNMKPGAARIALLKKGFDWRQRREVGPDSDVYRVFRQDPEPGRRMREGSVVTFFMPLRATVPDLKGKTRLEALDALQAAGLQGLAQLSGPDHRGKSEVYWQRKRPGQLLARGTLVKFRYRKIAVTIPMLPVPNVVRLEVGVAKAQLEAAGYRVATRALHVGRGRAHVVSQTPSHGSLLPRGSVITLTYRYGTTGPIGTFVRVPRVVGITLDAARLRLQSFGFRVRTTRSGGVGFGGSTKVIAQSPLGGHALLRGSLVHITYRHVGGGGGVVGTTVPHVVGHRIDRALSRLRGAGLNVRVSGIGARVRSQSISAGVRVPRGTTVTIRL